MSEAPADEQLMCQYQAGDANAFGELYQRHREGLFRYLIRGCKSQAVAEEIFQDVWTEVINARARYQPSAAFAAWLFRIGRNRMIDYLRRAGHAATPQSDDNIVQLSQANPAQIPERQLEASNEMQRFRNALMELPAEQREAFVLRHEKDFSVEQIADITGVERETAKSRLRYAMKRLRTAMAAEPESYHG